MTFWIVRAAEHAGEPGRQQVTTRGGTAATLPRACRPGRASSGPGPNQADQVIIPGQSRDEEPALGAYGQRCTMCSPNCAWQGGVGNGYDPSDCTLRRAVHLPAALGTLCDLHKTNSIVWCVGAISPVSCLWTRVACNHVSSKTLIE